MDSIKGSAQRIIPPSYYNFLRSGRDAALRAFQWPAAYFHPWRLESIQRLKKYQNRYSGKRCFVIGNGPSLQHTDLSFLKNEYTFGMNRVYLAFEEWGFQTSFLVSVNDLVIEQCYQDFHTLDVPKFFSWRAKDLLYPAGKPDQNTHFLYTTYTGQKFARRGNARFWEGATVTYVCLQLAYCMGFNEVILIGVDHNFETNGKANQTVVSTGDDPNHFSADYFGRGFRWQLPDLETSEISYQLAEEVYRAAGRQIIDATIGGKLSVFPKEDYLGLFN
jgi:hypothetical protein